MLLLAGILTGLSLLLARVEKAGKPQREKTGTVFGGVLGMHWCCWQL